MTTIDSKRPARLYLYADPDKLERAFTLGEFRLQPAADVVTLMPAKIATSQQSHANFLILSLSSQGDAAQAGVDTQSAGCLIIHKPEEFGERLHRAVSRMLPNWAGIDAAVSYGTTSPLGTVFTRARSDSARREWLFAWRPLQPTMAMSPVTITIGSLEHMAELRRPPL